MGSLVTNLMTVSGSPDAILAAIGKICGADPGEILAEAGRADAEAAWTAFEPWKLVPEPASISATQDGEIVDIGLAALSRGGGVDYLGIKQDKDPFLDAMPIEFTQTTESILRKLGLDRLSGEALVSAAEEKRPGCLEAGRRAIAAYAETGEFGWYDWRMKHWGVRAFGEELRVAVLEDGSVDLRFDSVNACPLPWIRAFAFANQALQIEGAAVEEDNDYAVFFVTDDGDPTGMSVLEHHEREGVEDAYRRIYGHAPRDPDAEDDPDIEEDIEP
jgi:hypothetical protein